MMSETMSKTAIPLPTANGDARSAQRHAPRARKWLRKIAWRLAPWLLPATLFALWMIGCDRGWIAPQILPPPSRVYETFMELARSGDLASHTLISLQRVMLGFAIGTLLGFVIGAALGLSRT